MHAVLIVHGASMVWKHTIKHSKGAAVLAVLHKGFGDGPRAC